MAPPKAPDAFPFLTEFANSKLREVLADHGCIGQDQTGATVWFWKEAKTWPVETHSDFDALASQKISEHIHSPGRAEAEKEAISELTRAIKSGTRKSVPAKYRAGKTITLTDGSRKFSTTAIQADATQDGWVKLLESGKLEGRQANVSGRNAGKAEVAKIEREMPVSQMALPSADPHDDRAADERDQVDPWDQTKPGIGADVFDQFSPALIAHFRQNQMAVRKRLFQEFIESRPDDCAFVTDFVERTMPDVQFRRGRLRYVTKPGKTTAAEHKRFKAIAEELRALEASILKI